MPKPLQTGDVAPDFSLLSSTGQAVHLYDLLERSQVVLFFYPKAFTPVCTAEVCGFRDSFDQFASSNATLLGISSDSPETLTRFASQYDLSFPLLSDEGGKTRLSFGVPKVLGVLPGRVTYVIGQDRRVKHITAAGFRSDVHVAESLKFFEDTPIEK